jgi:hypothetical protein
MAVVVTVSPNGIVNSKSRSPNDNAMFGPDTPGTTTFGIQEAMNSIADGGTVLCLPGTYTLATPIANTGNHQTLEFSPGCTILSQVPEGTEALFWVAQNLVSSSYAATSTYNNIRWLGHGCVVNCNGTGIQNVVEYTVKGPANSGIAQAYLVEFDGFTFENVIGNLMFVQTDNGTATTVVPPQDQTHDWKISRIQATWAATSSQLGWGIGISSVRLIHLDQIYCDFRNVTTPSGGGFSGFFVWSQRGNTADIWLTNSVFLIPPNTSAGGTLSGPNQILELQGSTSGSQTTAWIVIENCIFEMQTASGALWTGAAGFGLGGTGGVYIDDADIKSNAAFIQNFELRSCEFINVGISFRNNNASATSFGFVRMFDCIFNGNYPSSGPFSGSLSGRGPNSSGMAIAGIPAAPNTFTYANDDGFDETVFITGGTVTNVQMNGVGLPGTWKVFRLRAGDTVTVSYSSTLTLDKVAE